MYKHIIITFVFLTLTLNSFAQVRYDDPTKNKRSKNSFEQERVLSTGKINSLQSTNNQLNTVNYIYKEELKSINETSQSSKSKTISTQESLTRSQLKEFCKQDIENLCNKNDSIANCLNNNRSYIKEPSCSGVVERELGSVKINKDLQYSDLTIPKGSIISYSKFNEPYKVDLSKDTSYRNILFLKDEPLILRSLKNTTNKVFIIESGKFADNTNIIGFTYKGIDKPSNFSKHGLIQSGTISKNISLKGVNIPKGSTIEFIHKSIKVTLNERYIVKDISLVKNTPVIFNDDSITFDLRVYNSTNLLKLHGIKYKTEATIFYDGSIKSGILAEDITVQGKELKANTYVEFNKSGALVTSKNRNSEVVLKNSGIKAPTYLFALKSDGRTVRKQMFNNKELYHAKTVMDILSATGGNYKASKVDFVIKKDEPFKIVSSKVYQFNHVKQSTLVLEDSKGNLYYEQTNNKNPFVDTVECNAQCKKIVKALDSCFNRYNQVNCPFTITFKLAEEYNDKLTRNEFAFRSLSKFRNFLNSENINVNKDMFSDNLNINLSSRQIGNLVFNHNYYKIKSVSIQK